VIWFHESQYRFRKDYEIGQEKTVCRICCVFAEIVQKSLGISQRNCMPQVKLRKEQINFVTSDKV